MALIYGFHRLADVAQERINEQLVPVIRQAIDESQANYNATANALAELLAFRTTDFKAVYKSPQAGRLQPLDENGRARPRKGKAEYEIGLPLKEAGDAWGANYKTLVKMTVENVSDAVAQMQQNDNVWMISQMIAALFNDTDWTYPDNDYGNLTVKPIANGDAITYLGAGATTPATADHVLAQAADIADLTNPFPTVRAKLRRFTRNQGKLAAFVSPTLRDDIEALADFRERADPEVSVASDTEVLTGSLGIVLPSEAELFGYANGVFMVEWPGVPDDYFFAISTEGDRPIAMREEPEPELQGFNFVATRNDYPFEESQFRREAGFGAWNRVGAVVYRIGNGTYAIPTGYNPAQLP